MAKRGPRGYLKWNGAIVQQAAGYLLGQRVRTATAYLRERIKRAVSRPNPTGNDPSLEGEYPKMVTGDFRDKIRSYYNARTHEGHVGTPDPRGKWFETGTLFMAPRPWLSNAFEDYGAELRAILAKNQTGEPELDQIVRKVNVEADDEG